MQRNAPKNVNRFKVHLSNTGQTINAEDINKLGLALNAAEVNVLELSSESFKAKAFFALENNTAINSLFIDDFENSNYINHFISENVYYDTTGRHIAVSPMNKHASAKIISTKYISRVNGTVQKVILLVDDYIPGGAAVNYYVSTNDDDFIPIKKNQSTVTEITEGACGIIRADMRKNANGESPRIYGWALLYWDRVVELLFGLKNIDLSAPEINVEIAGNIMLIRDPGQKDKLIAVVEEDRLTELYYDEKGRLSTVKENGQTGIFSDELKYGPYKHWDGRSSELLLSITRRQEQ